MFHLPGVLNTVSRHVNSLLSSDEEFFVRLSELHGNAVRISVMRLGWKFDILFVKDGVLLAPTDETRRIDVEISGPPLAMLGLLLTKDMTQYTQTRDIHINGNAQLAHKISSLAGQLDVDWEELIAGKIGDIPAHQLCEWSRQFRHWQNGVRKSIAAAFTEFLQEEARHLPTRIETEHFMDDVDLLRDAVERAEARLQSLDRQKADRA